MRIIDAKSSEGNAFFIMGVVKAALVKAGHADKWNDVHEEMTSGDYNKLCEVAESVTADLGDASISIVNR